MAVTYLTPEMRNLLDESLYAIGLDERTVNHLEQIGVYTVEHLLNKTEAELRKVNHIGERTMEKIFAALANHGFHKVTA